MTRSDYISGPARLMLDRFGSEVMAAFGSVAYLVGSSLDRADFRDVDVRVILDDDHYDALVERWEPSQRTLGRFASMNLAFAVLGERMTGLPIDFQIQRRTDANRDFAGRRQPLVFSPGRRDGQ